MVGPLCVEPAKPCGQQRSSTGSKSISARRTASQSQRQIEAEAVRQIWEAIRFPLISTRPGELKSVVSRIHPLALQNMVRANRRRMRPYTTRFTAPCVPSELSPEFRTNFPGS
jgi:hypothetical protein